MQQKSHIIYNFLDSSRPRIFARPMLSNLSRRFTKPINSQPISYQDASITCVTSRAIEKSAPLWRAYEVGKSIV